MLMITSIFLNLSSIVNSVKSVTEYERSRVIAGLKISKSDEISPKLVNDLVTEISESLLHTHAQERYQEVMVALSESVMKNRLKRPLAEKSR